MYQLVFLKSAQKEYKNLDFFVQKHIKTKLDILCANPKILANNIKPLKSEYQGKFRLRIAQYRVIFQIKDNELIIIVVRIGHRKEIY